MEPTGLPLVSKYYHRCANHGSKDMKPNGRRRSSPERLHLEDETKGETMCNGA